MQAVRALLTSLNENDTVPKGPLFWAVFGHAFDTQKRAFARAPKLQTRVTVSEKPVPERRWHWLKEPLISLARQ
eukprot:1159896-Pelagomonas_calceolata.AAC.4